MALHAARRVAMQMIYSRMFSGDDCHSVLEDQPDLQGVEDDRGFIDRALEGTQNNRDAYDDIIQSFSPQRALERIPVLDRAILHLSLHELSLPDALPGVIINEAVELAKRFGDESDGRFINGLLGAYVRGNAQ